MTRLACYNDEIKKEYKSLGRRILKEIVKELGLQKGEYDIRWNPGGIAISGDHILHTDKIYIMLDDNCGSGWFAWRTCKGRKDYTGGPNQIVHWEQFVDCDGWEKLIRVLKVAQAGQWKDPSTGDIICDINQAIRLAAGVQ